jgi:hypothetical protein
MPAEGFPIELQPHEASGWLIVSRAPQPVQNSAASPF